MKVDGKDLLLWISLFLIGVLMGTAFGFVLGVWSGTINGFDEGVVAGIDYSNCVVEETPLYGVVTDRVLDKCWESYVYESY